MKSEELFEIDRKIKQIRKGFQQRQDTVTEWKVSLETILSKKQNPNAYLSKKYSESRLSHYRESPSPQKQLQHHLQQTRTQSKFFKNDLKELNELIKKRSLVSLEKLKNKDRLKIETSPKAGIKQLRKNNSDVLTIVKHDKQHNPFATLKADKLLQLYQQARNVTPNGQDPIFTLKKQLGIGIQATPFYDWLKVTKNQQKNTNGAQVFIRNDGKENSNSSLASILRKEVRGHAKIYFHKQSKPSAFQSRLMRIIEYGQNALAAL